MDSFKTKLGFGTLRLPLDETGNVDVRQVYSLFDEHMSGGTAF